MSTLYLALLNKLLAIFSLFLSTGAALLTVHFVTTGTSIPAVGSAIAAVGFTVSALSFYRKYRRWLKLAQKLEH
jgi:uncharacterized membrane protein